MKNITLKRLLLNNFKGIKALDIDFGQTTNIRGDNATGKTTIFDAFTWLLFDKDSKDRTTFEIKTLDANNEPLHGLDHSVTGVLEIDGKVWALKKTYREKWTKRRGDVTKELTGHETVYEINDVPVAKGEYTNKINEFLDADLFKLITNPLFFSNTLDWKKRRAILMEILGDISPRDVINNNHELEPLTDLLIDTDIDLLIRQTKATKAKLNNEIKAIPIRISEASNTIKDLDFKTLRTELKLAEERIAVLQTSIRNNTADEELKVNLRNEIYQIKRQLQAIETQYADDNHKVKQRWRDEQYRVETEALSKQREIQRIESEISNKKAVMNRNEFKLNELRTKYVNRRDETLNIPEHIHECPTCKRAFDFGDVESKIAELTANFNQQKAKDLESIAQEANKCKDVSAKLSDEYDALVEKLNASQVVASEVYPYTTPEAPTMNYTEDLEYKELYEKIIAAENKLEIASNDTALQAIKEDEKKVRIQIDYLKGQLAYEEQNKAQALRIEALEDELRKTSQQFADAEKIEYLCEEFIKTKVELLETSVNQKFSQVSFKLFSTQVNGGIAETCEALIDGVPFSNANTASQLNAGLDIINTLNDTYQVTAPVFLDNRESVTTIIPTKSQIVNLFVDSAQKTLIVEE